MGHGPWLCNPRFCPPSSLCSCGCHGGLERRREDFAYTDSRFSVGLSFIIIIIIIIIITEACSVYIP